VNSTPREQAEALVAAARLRRADLLVVEGVDIGAAVEQTLFGRIRGSGPHDPDPPTLVARAWSLLRAAARVFAALRPARRPLAGDVAVLVLTPAQARILRATHDALAARGLRVFALFESHSRGLRDERVPSARLADQLDARRALRLLGYEARLAAGLGELTADFPGLVGPEVARRLERALASAMGRIALYASCLDAVAGARPGVMATFNEIGRSSRLLPAAARRRGIPSLDIAHAEAADADAIRGIAYDRIAVFGPAAARVMQRAGVDPERVIQVGAPRFDELLRRHPEVPPMPAARRVVFASQWITGAMTAEVKRRTLEVALAAAAAADAQELVVRPHPIERDDVTATVLARRGAAGPPVRVEREEDLYDTLDGAWLLVTGWSNTVFEASLAGVPSLCVSIPGSTPPVDFAADGIALGATDEASAASVARRLLDKGAWRQAVTDARAALADRLGPLDGRAAERLADLVLDLSRRASTPED
jgi:hypothetical protein